MCSLRMWPAQRGLSAGWRGSNRRLRDRRFHRLRPSIFTASVFSDRQCGDGLQIPGLATPDPAPCSTEALDPNMRTPYVSTWSLGIQRAITNDLSLDVSYVGNRNHGTKLLGFADIERAAAWVRRSLGTEIAFVHFGLCRGLRAGGPAIREQVPLLGANRPALQH